MHRIALVLMLMFAPLLQAERPLHVSVVTPSGLRAGEPFEMAIAVFSSSPDPTLVKVDVQYPHQLPASCTYPGFEERPCRVRAWKDHPANLYVEANAPIDRPERGHFTVTVVVRDNRGNHDRRDVAVSWYAGPPGYQIYLPMSAAPVAEVVS